MRLILLINWLEIVDTYFKRQPGLSFLKIIILEIFQFFTYHSKNRILHYKINHNIFNCLINLEFGLKFTEYQYSVKLLSPFK